MPRIQTNLVALLFLCLISCAPSHLSYWGESEWVGLQADGTEVRLSELAATAVALNVYSPDCVPCWKEIPALHLLYEEIKTSYPDKALFMVVDPYQVVTDASETDPFGKVFALAKVRMDEEVRKRQMRIPILFMRPPFRVKPDGLVTGTPETLLFQTKPLRLYYNFLGAISDSESPQIIRSEMKYNFLKHQLGMESL